MSTPQTPRQTLARSLSEIGNEMSLLCQCGHSIGDHRAILDIETCDATECDCDRFRPQSIRPAIGRSCY
jgi:hypothetical protein